MSAHNHRVLFIDHSGALGGAEHSLIDLVTKLPLNASVVLLSDGPLHQRLKSLEVDVHVFKAGAGLLGLGAQTSFMRRLLASTRLPRLVYQIAWVARKNHLIYVNTKKALLFGTIAAYLLRKPLIWHQRDQMLPPKTLPLRSRISETLLIAMLNRCAVRVIAVSQATADSFIAAGGRKKLPVVIHNGLDPAKYCDNGLTRNHIRNTVGLPINVPLIGCFGRLTPWKGQRVLIEALTHLPGVHVALIGGAIFNETDYELALHKKVQHLGLDKRVHFLGHRNDVPKLIRAMDVVAHPSTEFDPCPRVVLEVLHSSVPLVATNVGGVQEMVEPDVSGLLIPPGDAVKLASALQHLLENSSFAGRLATQGQIRAQKHFTVKRVIQKVQMQIEGAVKDQ